MTDVQALLNARARLRHRETVAEIREEAVARAAVAWAAVVAAVEQAAVAAEEVLVVAVSVAPVAAVARKREATT